MKKIIAMILALIVMHASAGTPPKEAYKLAKEGKAIMIDVREKQEIEEGMIDIAVWFPLSKITSSADWEKDFIKTTNGKAIFLYCRSGNRSEKVKTILKENGIESENIGGYEKLKLELPSRKP